ncbi:oxygenase MpaB family protein [Pseudarthrobacter sp. P1]|uniref:oxygenase MpaB family protein n=1 Tax=Pseudarthrobacter sp. P1 TaxID=3418418 RepID=UPI003CF73484
MARTVEEIRSEGVQLAGGPRAILLQIAHPAVGRGVAEHSTFAERPLERLEATLTYVYAAAHGTEAQIAEVRRRVNRAHARVRGAESGDGRAPAYSAYDPALQLWVAATLYQTAVTVEEAIFGPLDEATAELLYQRYAALGTVLQMPSGLWPCDRAAFGAYWDTQLETLKVSDEARSVAHDLLHPAAGPLWLRLAMPTARLLTTGLLPQPLREQFGLPFGPARARRYHRLLRATAAVYPRLPRRLRFGLKNHYLRRLQPT